MATYSALPGKLNISAKRGDDFSALVDFSVSLTSFTMASTIISVVDGSTVASFTTTLSDAAAGKVNVALSDTQTSSLPAGTYVWRMVGTQGSVSRTYLEGYCEVES